MDEDELEWIRRKKLQELQSQYAQQAVMQEQERQIEEQKQIILRQILTPEARERLNTLRLAKPYFAELVENQLFLLVQAGKLNRQVDDVMLKTILTKLASRKREIKIERR